ncbi:ERF family protein [Breznakia sp. OttesenSCG-928-G09]|nr:ERF family protein [Breznakia sp. OttesenSCG-928-G09]
MNEVKDIYEKLLSVQLELKVPKNQTNEFAGFKFRSCEDIMEAVKPHLKNEKATIILDDKIVNLNDRYYVEATAKFICIETGKMIEVHSSARESQAMKGRDESQITGSTSSYARKYALNGLLAIDDTKDSDSNEKAKEDAAAKKAQNKEDINAAKDMIDALSKDLLNEFSVDVKSEKVVKYIESATGIKNSSNIDSLKLNELKVLVSAYKEIIVNKQKSMTPKEVNIEDL